MNEAYFLVFLMFNLSLGHSYQSQGIGVKIKGDNVTITWNKPSSNITSTGLEVYNIGRKITVYRANLSSIGNLHAVQLPPCQKYKVRLNFISPSGGIHVTDKDFVLGGKYLYTSLDTNITLTIPKLPYYFYTVFSPTRTILNVQGSSVVVNNVAMGRYKIKTTKQHFVISVQNVRQEDGGMYKAEQLSELREGECVVVFVTDKPTPPSLTYNEYPFVGNKANFTCISNVQRWPSDYSENLSYKFYWNGETRQPNIILRRSDEGTSVTCQATDDRGQLSSSSNSMILDPYYGPDNVHLNHNYKRSTVTEGQTFGPVTCSADCYPECDYDWRYLGRVQSYSPVLYIPTIDRNQTGVYGCYVIHPNNTEKRTALNIIVSVLYPPVFRQITFSADHEKDDRRSITEGETLKLFMYIESYPVSEINLHSPDYFVQPLVCTIDTIDHKYTANIEGLTCEEAGNYTIEAYNGIGEATMSSFDLEIQCKPKSIKFQRSKVAIRINSVEDTTVFVVSNPTPNVTWIQHPQYPWTISEEGVNHKYVLQSTIKISEFPLNRQLGLSICNTIGCVIKYVKTVPKGKPDRVRNITVVNITPYSAHILWYIGFDGGSTQNFSIILESPTDDSRTITVPLEEKDEGDLVLFKIGGLSAEAFYSGHIVSYNKYGKTKMEFEFETHDLNNGLSKRERIIYPLMICGIIGLVVVFVIIFKYKEKCKDSRMQIPQAGNTETTNTLVVCDVCDTPSIDNKQSKLENNATNDRTESKVVDEEWPKDDDIEIASSNDETSADSNKSCSERGVFYEEMKRNNTAGESEYDALEKY
ncbi:uncharacterized protein LOC127728378 [Mytilus californianus]|uniref:uncharacterized protein LOC127728378 n=1 Tax=Mytilus californianus TaxID=6549 RepID=UPI0022476359|nr:uncharacterized protein LOC127728378 [Mytilus californianus]